jgi:hypothetical protein
LAVLAKSHELTKPVGRALRPKLLQHRKVHLCLWSLQASTH